jgi:3-deoxy-D-manno-octulosonic acid kinase
MDLPPGYTRLELEDQGAVLVVRDGLADALVAAGVQDPERLVREAPSDLRGRSALARIDLGSEGRAIVRALQRGGLLGKWVRKLSLDPRRAEAELRVSAQAAARGARVLEVLAAVTRKAPGGYHHGLVTREVEGARDLLAVLRSTPGRRDRWRTLEAAGEAVRLLHEAGVDHVDLNVKNILLRPSGEALVIDLDKCRLGPGPAPWSVRRANLLRLLRSWVKLGCGEPQSVDPRDPLALARGYAGGDRALLRRLASLRASFPLRRLLWSLRPPRYP